MNKDEFVNSVIKLQESLEESGCEKIQLPQLVLIGDQSCGKSSVLEGIIGESLLPDRRTTRRPLIIQLVNTTDSEKDEWVEFVHRPNKVFRDFDAVSEEIELETDRMSGRKKCICTVPILMKFHTNRFLNFTIIDLPGLTRISVSDQPPDIENIIKKLIMKYARYQNSIILAVVAANTDIETSEIVQLARQADPSGYRTMCVVTKIDLMDAGTNATRVLLGKVVDFKLGIIGVVCRSQKELDDGATIKEILAREKAFLELNYSPIADRHGFPHLFNVINKIMIKHLKSALPKVEDRIQEKLESYNDSLYRFGNEIDSQESLLCLLTKFVAAFSDSVSGTRKNIGTYELEGGARIGYIFQDVFPRALNCLDPLEGLNEGAIVTALRNASGTKPSLFVPQHCFEQIVKKQIMNMIEPSVRCVTLVQEELIRMSHDCDQELSLQLEQFPKLKLKMYEILASLIRSRQQQTTEMVTNLINMHTAYINTAHPDFLSETDKYRIMFDMLATSKQNELRDSVPMFSIKDQDTSDEIGIIINSLPSEAYLIENMVISYFNIIRKSVADTVPKIIMHFMVIYTSDHLLTELVASIFSEGDPNIFLEEAPFITAQRQNVISIVESLTRASQVINEFLQK